MTAPHLVYFADPMCSWCWGFAPVIQTIAARFGDDLPIRLILGGLRPGNTTPMDAAAREEVRSHWQHVHEASGQPFDYAFFDRPHFVYDTEPASRAVVILRRRGMAAGLAALRRLHAAFYAEGQDVTDPGTLAALAAELGMDAAAFAAEYATEAAARETWTDFATAQQAGIRGFPTLLAGGGQDAPYALVTHGFQPAARIVPALERWLARQQSGTPTPDA